jgi:hypothetical protein
MEMLHFEKQIKSSLSKHLHFALIHILGVSLDISRMGIAKGFLFF